MLTLIVSLEAIFLSTFILISQNREAAIAERRNHLDLQINMLAEQENSKMLALLKRVADKVGVIEDTDSTPAKVLAQKVKAEDVVEKIEGADRTKKSA